LDLLASLCGNALGKTSSIITACFTTINFIAVSKKVILHSSPMHQSGRSAINVGEQKPWHEAELRKYLHSLRPEDKALLRLLADSGGSRLQRYLMDELPFLKGRSSNSKGFGTSMPVKRWAKSRHVASQLGVPSFR